MELKQVHIDTFRSGSKTYFNSSLFFPHAVRTEVFVLYAFVRTADNFVDTVPQQPDRFHSFREEFEKAVSRGSSDDPIIDGFVSLARLRSFDPQWAQAFLHSMALDLSKRVYATVEETLEYIYGSAEVIGLFMARILGLSEEASNAAKMLGRAMQYINFIRDIDEDNALGRIYLPIGETSLPDLRSETAHADPGEFRRFVEAQLERYVGWQREGESGFRYIPYRMRVPIETASRMYGWTGRAIRRDPFVVFRRKVKPSRPRIIGAAFASALIPRRKHD